MARPKKTPEVEVQLEKEAEIAKMIVCFDTTTSKVVLIPASEVSPRYKHI